MARPKRFSALRNWLNSTAASSDGDDQQQGQGGGADDGDDDDDQDQDQQQQDQDQGGDDDQDQDQQQDQDQGGQGGADASHAQYGHGVRAERRRWAQVLSSDAAEHRVEAATGLLVEDLPAERIIGMLPRMPMDANTAALRLLASAPKHNLRGAASDEGGKDAGATSRKRAVARHNQSVQGGRKSRPAPRTRKAAAKGGEE